MTTTTRKQSAPRIESFVSDFIRSEWVQIWTAERDNDFINEPERAARIADGGGATIQEVIGDQRDAFDAWVKDRKSGNMPFRFMDAVNAHFDAVEAWHEQNGSLDQEIV